MEHLADTRVWKCLHILPTVEEFTGAFHVNICVYTFTALLCAFPTTAHALAAALSQSMPCLDHKLPADQYICLPQTLLGTVSSLSKISSV